MAKRPKSEMPNWDDPKLVEQVERMAGLGLRLKDIAHVCGVSHNTLTKYMGDVMERGRSCATANVAETCYRMAVSGKVPAATFFWLKCRGRWREVHHVEVPPGESGVLLIGNQPKTVEEWEQRDGE